VNTILVQIITAFFVILLVIARIAVLKTIAQNVSFLTYPVPKVNVFYVHNCLVTAYLAKQLTNA